LCSTAKQFSCHNFHANWKKYNKSISSVADTLILWHFLLPQNYWQKWEDAVTVAKTRTEDEPETSK